MRIPPVPKQSALASEPWHCDQAILHVENQELVDHNSLQRERSGNFKAMPIQTNEDHWEYCRGKEASLLPGMEQWFSRVPRNGLV
jgi:hypothetical protein